MDYSTLSDIELAETARDLRARGFAGDREASRTALAMEAELRRRIAHEPEPPTQATLPRHDEYRLEGAPQGDSAVQSVCELLRNLRVLLGMEIAYVAHFDRGQRIIAAIDTDSNEVQIEVGDTTEAEETYCWRVVHGQLEQGIPDARQHSLVRDLPITTMLKIRSYLASPVVLRDGTLYGTVCCISHMPRTAFGARDYDALRSVASLVGRSLDAHLAENRPIDTLL